MKSILFYSLIFISFNCFGGSKTDSLSIALNNCKNDTDRINTLNDLSKYLAGGLPDSAVNCAERAFQISRKINYEKGISNYYFNIGLISYYKGDYKKGIEEIKKSLELKTKAGDKKGVAGCYNNLGLIFGDLGNHPAAIDCYFKSLKLKQELGDRKGIASTFSNIGMIQQGQGNYKESLKWYLKGFKICLELNDKKGLSFAYNNIGPIYFFLGDHNRALLYLFKGLRLKEELEDQKGIASSLNNISNLYVGLLRKNPMGELPYIQANGKLNELPIPNLLDSILKFQSRADEIQTNIGDKRGRVFSLIGIGNLYLLKNNHREAIAYFHLAREIAEKIGARKNLAEVYEGLTLAYQALNEYKSALDYHFLFKNCSDSLFNSENKSIIVRTEMMYDFEKKDQENALKQQQKDSIAKEKLSKQKLLSYAGAGGAIMCLMLSLTVVRRLNERKKANKILEEKNALIEEKNKDITDSIRYAERIQQAMLPFQERIIKAFPEFFILFKPRDMVSGDFYWFYEKNGLKWIAVVDCTGHGVPGAFMSMIGMALLNDIVGNRGVTDPGLILTELDQGIRHALKQDESGSRDGMDLAICSIDESGKKVYFAGAMNSLYYFQNKQAGILNGNKFPVGGTTHEEAREFTTQTLALIPGTVLYLATDGYQDQFGGPKGKKFKSKHLQNLLLTIQEKDMEAQKNILASTLENWKGNLAQVDDITVIGLRI